MKNMTLSAIASACGGILHGEEKDGQRLVESVVTDSRKAGKDSLFIAIAGARVDGHSFIKDVYQNGALACVSEKPLDEETTGGHPYIEVKSSLQALKDIAEFYRTQLNIKVVGITGSVGKTSTKETIAAVLSRKFNVLKTAGNFNNEIGLPLTVFQMTEETEVAVLEMGISDFGEMTRLTQIAKPDICVITNIGICHLENLKNRDGILKAKTEIFKSMSEDGYAVLNGDDDKLVTVTEVNGKAPEFFGIDNTDLRNSGGIYADNITNMGLDGTVCDINVPKDGSDKYEIINVHIPIPGRHMVYNAMAAAAVGTLMGLDADMIKAGIESLEAVSGRNHIIHANSMIIIDDCYNANPVSMRASIDVLCSAVGRKVCILGDMFELGEDEKKLHHAIGEYAADKKIDVLIAAGALAFEIAEGARGSRTEVHYYKDRDSMLDDVRNLLKPNDNILIKASHGMEFTKVVEALCNC